MTDNGPGAAIDGGPGMGLTDAEKLAALDAYLKVLKPVADELRTKVAAEMGRNHDERKGAFLPDGTKLAAITRSDGKKSVKVTDESAALAWAEKNYPGEVQTVRVIRPAFLKKLLDVAGSLPVGSAGLDPATGQILDFIQVSQGSPYVIVTSTKEGAARMATLAHGFAGMLEPAKSDDHDPAFADRLENGAYDR